MNKRVAFISFLAAGSSLLLFTGCGTYDDGYYHHGHGSYYDNHPRYNRTVVVEGGGYRHDNDYYHHDHGSRDVVVVNNRESNNYRTSYAQNNYNNRNYHGGATSRNQPQGHGGYQAHNQQVHNQPVHHGQPTPPPKKKKDQN